MAPTTVDQYISGFPSAIQDALRAVRAVARSVAPQAEERLSYRMPALFQGGVLLYYGAFKHHIGLFPPVADPSLRRRAAKFAGPKGNLQFPYEAPLPIELIRDIVVSRLTANLAKSKRSSTAQRTTKSRGAA